MHIFTSPVCDTTVTFFFLINLFLQLLNVGLMQKPLKAVLKFMTFTKINISSQHLTCWYPVYSS